jgi:hypothetical protein
MLNAGQIGFFFEKNVFFVFFYLRGEVLNKLFCNTKYIYTPKSNIKKIKKQIINTGE